VEKESSHWIAHKRLWKSHLILRRILGLLGIFLPLVLLIWGATLSNPVGPPLNSISDHYYYSGMGHFFVGTLMAIGFFLAAYRGYDKNDNIAGWIACIFALCVAFFPNHSSHTFIPKFHFGCAVGLFLVLSFFSIFLFTKTKPKEDKNWKQRIRYLMGLLIRKSADKDEQRNRVHVICGLAMLGFMAFYALFRLALWRWDNSVILNKWNNSTLLFWIETFMLWAFGISWMVKGRWLWLSNDLKTAQKD
jgi:hypothetical protein